MSEQPAAWSRMSPADKRDAVRQLIQYRGMTYDAAAASLGVTRNVVAGVVERSKRSGVPIRSQNPARQPPPGGGRPPPDRRVKVKRHQGLTVFKPLVPPGTPTIDPTDAWLALPGSNPVRIEDHHEGCRWPIGDAPPIRYCNEPTLDHLVYCAAHTLLGVRPSPPRVVTHTARRDRDQYI